MCLHIVHLMASPFVGGPERQVLGLACHLGPAFRTSFLSFSERGQARSFLEEARCHSFEAIELRQNAPRIFRCIAEVTSELRRLQADLICCSGYKPDLIGWRAARRAGIPVVGIAHGWTSATQRVRVYESVDRFLLRWMDAVVCVSQSQAARARRAWVPERKIVVIPNAIAADAVARTDPGLREGLLKLFPVRPRLVVGTAGRLSPEKNHALLIEAAARVGKERADIGFVVFGDGPLRPALEGRINRLGLRDRFVLAGFRADVASYLPHLDLAVLSSTTEGLPVFLLEAFAAGIPIVATAVGGIPEVVEEGKSGYLVPSADPGALAARILDALRNDEFRHALGRHGQERVRRDFSAPQQAARYAELFTRLAGAASSLQ
jgi:glycosyltransferase involved in cell wall biosynthesis